MPNPVKRIRMGSSWIYAGAALLLSLLTIPLLSAYGLGHGRMRFAFDYIKESDKLFEERILPEIKNEETRKKIDELRKWGEFVSSELQKAGGFLMRWGSFYHLTGLVAVVLSIVAVIARRPWWAGLISLPWSLLALMLGAVMM